MRDLAATSSGPVPITWLRYRPSCSVTPGTHAADLISRLENDVFLHLGKLLMPAIDAG